MEGGGGLQRNGQTGWAGSGQGGGALTATRPSGDVGHKGSRKVFIFDRFYKGFGSRCDAMGKVKFYQGFTRGLECILCTFEGNGLASSRFGAGFHRG